MSVLVGRKAPDFTAAAVAGNGQIINKFQLSEQLKGKYGLIVFYPLNFTFVCPSELVALNNRLNDFISRNVEVIAISIDSHFSHIAWRNTPVEKGGIGQVGYSMVADITHDICQAYGVEHPEIGVAFRGTFIIDKEGVVRSEIINDLPIGRNMDELLRLVDAVQFHEQNGEVCPANWEKGKVAIKATSEGIASYLTDHAEGL